MPAFHPGQVWTYQTRPDETSSRLTILKVENLEGLGPVVHISIAGVQVGNPSIPESMIHEIGHMPFAEDALAASVVELESTGADLPDFQDGYDQWLAAVQAGQGGIFTISVAEGVTFIAGAMGQ